MPRIMHGFGKNHRRVFAALAAILLLAAACGRAVQEPSADGTMLALESGDAHGQDRDIAGTVNDSGTEAKSRQIHSNRSLANALDTSLACVEREGIDIDLTHDGIGGLEYGVSAATEEELARAHETIDTCLAGFRQEADSYLEAFGPSEEEIAEADRISLRCIEAVGIAADSLQEAVHLQGLSPEDREEVARCAEDGAAHIRARVLSRAAAAD